MTKTPSILAALACLAAATPLAAEEAPRTACPASPEARFDPATDLLLAHFDLKSDVDDMHSVAAVATMLAHPDLACVAVFAVTGTYGTQEGPYVPADALFDLAFGEAWTDAHADPAAAAEAVAERMEATLTDGGDVWVMEGGQADVTAAAARLVTDRAPDLDLSRLHVIQHSDWNEEVTSPEALETLRSAADYRRIPDGNGVGNGTPGFKTEDGALWPRLVEDEQVGEIWAEARRAAEAANGLGYDNTAIGAGGLDFSDAAEAAWIFGYEDLRDHQDFAETFLNR